MNKILVETSARHVHLSREDLDILFGKGFELTFKKDLSQPGQFATNERVTVVGPKRGKTIWKNVLYLPHPSIFAASSRATGTFDLMKPWKINTDMDMANPVCMKIRVDLWFRRPSFAP